MQKNIDKILSKAIGNKVFSKENCNSNYIFMIFF